MCLVLDISWDDSINNCANKYYAHIFAHAGKSVFRAKSKNNAPVYGMINMFFGENLSS